MEGEAMSDRLDALLAGFDRACNGHREALHVAEENPDIQFTQNYVQLWVDSIADWKKMIERHMDEQKLSWELQQSINEAVKVRLDALEQHHKG
jgi:hypothetical protein